MENTELIERLVEVEQRSKSNTKRIDEHNKKIEDIHTLACSMKEMATEMKAMREDVGNINERLKQVEEKPLKDYEDTKQNLKSKIISFIVGIVLAFLAFKLGLDKFI